MYREGRARAQRCGPSKKREFAIGHATPQIVAAAIDFHDRQEAVNESLRLDDALNLLQHAGWRSPANVQTGSVGWLQSVVDGLCELSSRDPLTGLVNRRHFERSMVREIDRVARTGEPALLLMLDIDHFKRINDSYGHSAGDIVIQSIAATLGDCVRPMDTVARVGGEEFAIILPNCPAAFGKAVAERIRQRVARQSVALVGGQALNITVSVGGAFAPQWVRSSPTLWTDRADQQLYRAKHEGRNRTCLEMPPLSRVSAEEKSCLFGVFGLGEPPDADVDADADLDAGFGPGSGSEEEVPKSTS